MVEHNREADEEMNHTRQVDRDRIRTFGTSQHLEVIVLRHQEADPGYEQVGRNDLPQDSRRAVQRFCSSCPAQLPLPGDHGRDRRRFADRLLGTLATDQIVITGERRILVGYEIDAVSRPGYVELARGLVKGNWIGRGSTSGHDTLQKCSEKCSAASVDADDGEVTLRKLNIDEGLGIGATRFELATFCTPCRRSRPD